MQRTLNLQNGGGTFPVRQTMNACPQLLHWDFKCHAESTYGKGWGEN